MEEKTSQTQTRTPPWPRTCWSGPVPIVLAVCFQSFSGNHDQNTHVKKGPLNQRSQPGNTDGKTWQEGAVPPVIEGAERSGNESLGMPSVKPVGPPHTPQGDGNGIKK